MEPVAVESFPTIRNFGNRVRVLLTVVIAAVLYAIAWTVAGFLTGLLIALWIMGEGGGGDAELILVLIGGAIVLGAPIGLVVGLTRIPTRRRALDELVRHETHPWGSPACPWFQQDQGGERPVAPASDADARALQEATNLVTGLAIAAGVPVPQVALVTVDAPNAFVLGTRPSDTVIGVTRGLFARLSRAQAEAVIAWQVTRVASRDAALTTWATAFVADGITALDAVGDGTQAPAADAPEPSDPGDQTSGVPASALKRPQTSGGVPFGVRRTLAAYEAMVLRGLARRRDRAAIQITRNPQALLEAFEVIAADPQEIPCVSRATTSLWLEVVPATYAASKRDQELARSLSLAPRIAALRAALGLPPVSVTGKP